MRAAPDERPFSFRMLAAVLRDCDTAARSSHEPARRAERPRQKSTCSFRQTGLAQCVGVLGVILRPAKRADAILEVGQAHVGVELERARDGLLRLLPASSKRIAGGGNA